MVRKIAGIALLAAAIHAQNASALGLGEIAVHSTLNQPLNASIALSGLDGLSPDQLLVKLASNEDFERAGVDREYLLSDLRFSVQGGAIKVSTPMPVREPYLNFLVEVKWPTGRVLREYTVLLDIQPFDDSQTRSVSMADSTPRRVAQPVSARPAVTEQTSMAPLAGEGGDYTVRTGDTLWGIARRVQPEGANLKTTVDALRATNMQSFPGGDGSRLQVGQVLRLPSAREILAAQSGDMPQAAPPADAAIDASRRSDEPATTASEDQGHLRLASPAAPSTSEAGSAAQPEDGEKLKGELAATLENLDKTRQENEELKAKMGDLEQQIATLQTLMDKKDEQLNLLAERAEQPASGAEGGQASPDAPAPTPSDSQEKTVATVEKPVDLNYAGQEGAAPQEEKAPAEPAKPKKPAPEADNTLLYGGIGAVVLMLLGGGYWWMRRRQDEHSDEPLAPVFPASETPLPSSADFATVAVPVVSATTAAQDDGELLPEEESPQAAATSGPDGDPIAAADVYLAYGRHPQAVEVLEKGIEATPERAELYAKLAEVHAEANHREGFEQACSQLEQRGEFGLLGQVRDVASAIPHAAGWLIAATATAALDDVFAEPVQDETPEVSASAIDAMADEPAETTQLSDEFQSLDFDTLDLDGELEALAQGLPEALESADNIAAEPEPFEDLGLDLDLELDRELASLDDESKGDDAASDIEAALPEEFDLGSFTLDTGLEELTADLTPEEDEGGSLASGGDELSLDELSLELDSLDETLDSADVDDALASLEDELDFSVPEHEAAPALDEELEADLAFLDQLDAESLDAPAAAEPTAPVAEALSPDDMDEVSTKLDLARAYIDMGDAEGAREILQEVVLEGSAAQQEQARGLLSSLA